jgi:hypothetical protein
VALLNASGFGAGYLYLRRWRRWAFHAFCTGLLLSVAYTVGAAGHDLWRVVLVGWLGWMVLDGWMCARGLLGPYGGGPRPQLGPAVPAVMVALALIALVGAAFWAYAAEGQREFDRAWAAEKRGDCRGAIAHYSTMTTVYELTLSGLVRLADRGKAECSDLLAARGAGAAGDYQGAISRLSGAMGGYQSVLLPAAREQLASTYRAWAGALTASGDYPGALGKLKVLSDRFYRTDAWSRVRTDMAATYLAWAASLEQKEDWAGSLERYGAVLWRFSGTPQAATAGDDVDRLIQRARTIVSGRHACTGLAMVDAFGEVRLRFGEVEPLRPTALLRCGEARLRWGQYPAALTSLEDLLHDYPYHRLAGRARSLSIGARVGVLLTSPHGGLGPPSVSPANSFRAVLVVWNSSSRGLDVLVSGPERAEAVVDRCSNCSTPADVAVPSGCSGGEPSAFFRLTPGRYDVVVRIGRGRALRVDAGSWLLDGGTRYDLCMS